jgi:isovaleryl-CoA dehydrogenase
MLRTFLRKQLPVPSNLRKYLSSSSNSSAPFGHLTSEQIAIKDASRSYFMDNLNPIFMEMDDSDVFPPTIWPTLGKQGYMGLTISPEYGGVGLDYLTAGLIAEELHYANSSVGISHSAHDNLCANNIYLNGTEEQKKKYLPGLCDGTLIGALGMSEPGAGSDAIGSMATRAVRDNCGNYVLNGTKLWITNGPVADVILLYAKTDPEKNTQGVSAFIIETKDLKGFSVGKKQNKMGFRGSPQSELIFDECVVPKENLIGKENEGVKIMMSGLDLERAWVAVGSTGVAERALDLALAWSKERKQFQQPIANFQLIQDKLARMYTSLTSAQLLVYKALEACNYVGRGEAGRGEIHKLSASAFMASTDAVKVCCDEGVQIFGGMGFMRDMEINALYRTIKTSEIAGGSMEIRKLIVAKELLSSGIR